MPSEDMLSATESATENPVKEQVAETKSDVDEPDEAAAQNGQDDEAAKAAPAKTTSEEFVSAGEGTVSDGRGGSKKIFFLQQKKEDQPRWLKKMSDGLSSVGAAANETMHSMGAAANDTVSRLVKSTEKREEKKEAEKMEAEDKSDEEAVATKDRVKAIVDAGRHSLDAASTRFSGLMASIKPGPKPSEEASVEAPAPAAADASMTSRLAALRIAMAHMSRKEDKPDEVAALKAEVTQLKDTVKLLVEKVAKLEASANLGETTES